MFYTIESSYGSEVQSLCISGTFKYDFVCETGLRKLIAQMVLVKSTGKNNFEDIKFVYSLKCH